MGITVVVFWEMTFKKEFLPWMKRLNYLEDFIITLSFQITMFYDLWRNNANIEFRTENRKSKCCIFSSHILCTIKLEFRQYRIKRHELFVQYGNVAAIYFVILQKFSLINYIKSYLQKNSFVIKCWFLRITVRLR